jgi:uncharacterized protein
MKLPNRLFKKTNKSPESDQGAGEPAADTAAGATSVSAGNTEATNLAGQTSSLPPGAVGKENWRVSVSRDKVTTILDYTPRPGLLAPAAAELLRAAVELGMPEDGLYSEDKLNTAIKNADASGIALRGYSISEDIDGGFEINISDDKLNAALSMRRGRGQGTSLELSEVGKALRSSGIKNLKFDQLKADILAFYRGKEMTIEGYELKLGKPPTPGGDQKLVWAAKFIPATDLAALKKELEDVPEDAFDGIESIKEYPVDAISDAAFVKKDFVVAKVSNPDPGKPGEDVFGVAISATAGQKTPVELHENCVKRDTEIAAAVDGVLEKWDVDGTPHIRIRPHSDASIAPFIADDGMSATVDLIQGVGTGTRLHVEDARQALITAGVIRGINLDVLAAAIKSAEEEGAVKQIVVAEGEEPQAAGESALDFKIEIATGKAVTIQEGGRADYKNQDRFTRVDEGTLIAEVATLETTMREGFDVRGNKIKGTDAKDFTLEIGENIKQERDEQGSLRLIAEVSGELSYDGKSMDIVGVHTIKGDVGPATGNVRFSGPVHVSGNVLPGFYVIAAGEIKIAEGVEAALLSSGKSIFVNQGIIGGGKAGVRAREDITAAFAEHVMLMSVNNISLKSACLQCNVKCNGKLTLDGERGNLVGGQAKARLGVELTNLGSKNGAKTNISFGQDYLIGDKIELEENELEKLKNGAVQIDLKIHQAEKEDGIADLKRHRLKKVQILKLIDKRTERLFWLREKFEQHFDAEVTVRGTAYPGVTLETHGRTFEVAREMNKVVLYFNQEKGIIEDRPVAAGEK